MNQLRLFRNIFIYSLKTEIGKKKLKTEKKKINLPKVKLELKKFWSSNIWNVKLQHLGSV